MTDREPKKANFEADDLLEHYEFDYAKAKPNRFADAIGSDSIMVVLDPDVAEVFPTTESVNETLRVIASALQNLPRNAEVNYPQVGSK